MTSDLHYAPSAVLKRCLWMVVAAAVVLGDYVAHANGGMPRVFGLGVVASAALIAAALYLVAVTIGLTIGLLRGGGVALATDHGGITVRQAWFAKTLPWSDVARVALDVRYTRYGHYTVAAVHEVSGVARVHAIDTRLLAEPLAGVGDWIDAAERQRVAAGGRPYVTPTAGIAGYNARHRAKTIAADIAAAQ